MKEIVVSVYFANQAGHVDAEVVRFLADTEERAIEQIIHLRTKYDNILKRKGNSFFMSKLVEIRIEDGAGII